MSGSCAVVLHGHVLGAEQSRRLRTAPTQETKNRMGADCIVALDAALKGEDFDFSSMH
jgi:hypothetical protein